MNVSETREAAYLNSSDVASKIMSSKKLNQNKLSSSKVLFKYRCVFFLADKFLRNNREFVDEQYISRLTWFASGDVQGRMTFEKKEVIREKY